MNAGPSKEQIDNYYRTSRKYFDELARQYYEKDRDFYNKYFAPYYSNPFLAGSKKGGSIKARLIFVIAGSLLAIAIIAVSFLYQEHIAEEREKDVMKFILDNKADEQNAKSLLDSISSVDSIQEKLNEPLLERDNYNDGARSVKKKPR